MNKRREIQQAMDYLREREDRSRLVQSGAMLIQDGEVVTVVQPLT